MIKAVSYTHLDVYKRQAYNIINVATIDIIILIVIGAGAIVGFVKGFIRQLASILGLIVRQNCRKLYSESYHSIQRTF